MASINDSELERQVARMLRAADKVEGAEAMAREQQAIAERQRLALVDDSERSGSLEAAVHAADVQGQARDEQELRRYVRQNPEIARRPSSVTELSQRFGRASLEAVHRAVRDAQNGVPR